MSLAKSKHQTTHRTVLLFDSGVGGISIWREIRRQQAELGCIYLMDNALRPYGELDEPVILHRVVQLIRRALRSYQPDLVVVACNSASTLVLPALRERFDIPVVGVVPAIKPAAALARDGSGVVALLATPGTIRRKYTDRLIQEFAADCTIRRIGSSELVRLAERKLARGKLDAKAMARVQNEIRSCLLFPLPEAVVLGCTHFPLIKDELQQCLSNKMSLVDPSEAVAKQVVNVLSRSNLAPVMKRSSSNVVIATKEESGWLSEPDRVAREGFEQIVLWEESG